LNTSLNEGKFGDVVVNKGTVICCEIPKILFKIGVSFKQEYMPANIKSVEYFAIEICENKKIQFKYIMNTNE
jgi:hypothetical protein